MTFRKILMAAGAASLALAITPATAHDHGKKTDKASHAALNKVLLSEKRAKDRPRDDYRNPVETLGFFQVSPEQRVVEFGPGGGWYTRVLAPYISEKGAYFAMNSNSDGVKYRNEEQEKRAKSWATRFPAVVTEWTGVDAGKVTAFESDEIPDDVAGTIDRVLVFRSMHGMMNRNIADEQLKAIRKLLKDDGMVGVVQHRAPASESYDRSKGTRGYLKQENVIKLFDLYGFDLVASSEINANPKDKADYERGVWTLPPVLATSREDAELQKKYKAIGESDRMTLLFKKRS